MGIFAEVVAADEARQARFIDIARRFLDGAPAAEPNPRIIGWGGGIGYLCGSCAARITARGCRLDTCGAVVPFWEDTDVSRVVSRRCAVCLA